MTHRLPSIALALGFTALAALPAHAQFAKPEDAVKYRQSAMFMKQISLGRVFAMANGRIPFDAKVAQEHADALVFLDRFGYTGFVEGTATVGNSRTKAEAWTERAKFDAAEAKNGEDIARLAAAARTGNLDQIKASVGAVGQSCKACHDTYRRD